MRKINKKIVKVYGLADKIVLNFTQTEDGFWEEKIPIDTEDGKYITSIYGENSDGKIIAQWIGTLYVSNGISHLHILEEETSFWLLPERNLPIELKPERFQIILKKECDYHGS